MQKQTRRILVLTIVVLSLAITTLFGADDGPWYYGKRIASFTNEGLQHADTKAIVAIQDSYRGKSFTNELFDALQSELYGLDYFLYFYGDAARTGEGGNELAITFTFYELPYIERVSIEGNAGIKTKDITAALRTREGSFFDEHLIERSKSEITTLYLKKGYADVVIDAEYLIDDETNTVELLYVIDEGVQKRLGEIAFTGNAGISGDVLKKQLSSKVIGFLNSGYFNPETIEEDIGNLQAFYLTQGYLDATVLDYQIEDISTEGEKYQRVRVTFDIDEGEQWFFGGIEVEGNTVFSDEEFASLITIKQGAILDVSRVARQIEQITDLYWNNGYIFNAISSDERRDLETHEVFFTLFVQENEQAIIEAVHIEGLTKTKSYVFERELAFGPGDIFSKEKLIRSAQNIYNTLIVTDVQFDIITGSEPGTVVPVFQVTEGNQMDIQFGATFGGSVDGFPVSGFLQWSDKNLGGKGRDLAISTNLSPDTQTFSISFSDGWVKNRRWANGLSFTFERSEKINALQRGTGSPYYTGVGTNYAYPKGYDNALAYAAANQALPARQYLMQYTYYRISLGYNTGYTFMFDAGALSIGGGLSIGLNYAYYDNTKYDPFEKLIQRYRERWQFSNRLSLSFSWDGRDLVENTSRGYYISQNFTYAGGFLFGLSNYIRSSTSASAYQKLWSFSLDDRPANVVAGLTSTVSMMLPQYYYNLDTEKWGWHDAQMGATRYEMLYIDGMNMGRGHSVVFDQAFLWDTQGSISWPLAHNVLSAEVFISGTGVSPTLKQLKFDDLTWYFSAGGGIKLKVPGFPLGLYLVKNAIYESTEGFSWVAGRFFKGKRENSGLSLVLAITTTLY